MLSIIARVVERPSPRSSHSNDWNVFVVYVICVVVLYVKIYVDIHYLFRGMSPNGDPIMTSNWNGKRKGVGE